MMVTRSRFFRTRLSYEAEVSPFSCSRSLVNALSKAPHMEVGLEVSDFEQAAHRLVPQPCQEHRGARRPGG